MVSRRNFFVITAMLLVILFMFQMIAVVKERWNDYNTNEYAKETLSEMGQEDMWASEETEEAGKDIVFLGAADSDCGQIAAQWGTYTKQEITYCDSILACSAFEELPELLLVDSACLSPDTDARALYSLVKQGVNMIFCTLPDASYIREDVYWQALLGIRQVLSEQVTVSGVRLYEGFLLGGEAQYIAETDEEEKKQDLDLEIPWYYISSGTKTYMAGMLEEDTDLLSDELDVEDRNELLPAIIWRNSIDDARIFAVNGTFMTDETGIGILSAMQYEMEPYALYPVVNAQNVTIANGPCLADENSEELEQVYSRKLNALFRDIVWPGITALCEKNDMRVSCMLTPQMAYTDENEPQSEKLPYYLKIMKESAAEMGLSASRVGSTGLQVKLRADNDFFGAEKIGYTFAALYLPEEDVTEAGLLRTQAYLKDLKTVVTEYQPGEPVFSYINDTLTRQSATSDGSGHTFSDDLRLKSMETGLGYSHVLLDMEQIFWPQSEEDHWEKVIEEFSSDMTTYWKPFSDFSSTTLSESDQRIRRFLALDYTQKRQENVIRLSVTDFEEEAWFLLRTHGEKITSVKGASYVQIEDDAYLLRVTATEVEIEVEDEISLWYTE